MTEFLNELYSNLDSCIDEFDVYKVMTGRDSKAESELVNKICVLFVPGGIHF